MAQNNQTEETKVTNTEEDLPAPQKTTQTDKKKLIILIVVFLVLMTLSDSGGALGDIFALIAVVFGGYILFEIFKNRGGSKKN